MSRKPKAPPPKRAVDVDMADPALVERLAKLLHEAEKRAERTRSLRSLDR
jgi:hypothetical protein